jgi:hypothetical protein
VHSQPTGLFRFHIYNDVLPPLAPLSSPGLSFHNRLHDRKTPTLAARLRDSSPTQPSPTTPLHPPLAIDPVAVGSWAAHPCWPQSALHYPRCCNRRRESRPEKTLVSPPTRLLPRSPPTRLLPRSPPSSTFAAVNGVPLQRVAVPQPSTVCSSKP